MRTRALLIAATAALLVAAAPASAATFDVTTTADTAGACPPQPPQLPDCTLRAAVNASNANPGDLDTIDVPAGTYTLTAALPEVARALIVGADASTTRVQAGGAFRVFALASEALVGIHGLTVANGQALTSADPIGGNILVGSGATLVLDHSRVTGGTAGAGGGIGLAGGSAAIASSLIDNNHAQLVLRATIPGQGGGIVNATPGGRTLQITDSTIAFNTALTGAGIVVRDNAANTTRLTRSTVAFNDATSGPGGGIYLPDTQSFTATGSIVSNNTGNLGSAPVVIGPSNCAGPTRPTSAGYNVESLADCNFIDATDRRNTDPQLATALAGGSQTPVLAIPATSPAVNRIPAGNPACTGADQRDVGRPQGAACDAGAFELLPPDVSIDSGAASGSSAAFTFSSSAAGVRFECRLDGPSGAGAFGPCSSPASFSGLPPGNYTFLLRATDAAGNQTTTSRAFSVPAPPPPPPPTPVPNKTVVIQPVSGKTLVKLPGSNKFELVDVTRGIPVGSTVDTRKSKIRLYAIPKAGKPVESALFYDGIFKVTQSGGITELRLVEQLAACPKGKAASAAAKKKPKSRKLWGDGTGSFRTRGQYSSATVRGTKWLVQDSCGKTLTRVSKGVVQVQDLVKKTKFLLRAPKRYTARKRH
ncbi:choice-of-anchor Q domain-containing protein [Candidatus Solirubrobacter pratensis]|uniref:choice-of-anchor Q domain-containing protein n=1 Tax=Candidatus Solirubrobacter pratensis TaxID=1298857 RepID=UPI00041A7A7B|nr:choice-of-anchor Q domain-containing protein [Candidatus Solirubrobacter pratensis]